MDREWTRVVIGQAVERLHELYRSLGKETYFEVFRLCDVDRKEEVTNRGIAEQLRISPVDVKNYLADARRRFRKIAREVVAETVSDDAGLAEELLELFGEGLAP